MSTTEIILIISPSTILFLEDILLNFFPILPIRIIFISKPREMLDGEKVGHLLVMIDQWCCGKNSNGDTEIS